MNLAKNLKDFEKITIPPEKRQDNTELIKTIITKMEQQEDGQYSVKKKMRFKTSMQRSDLCDYSDAYIVLKGRINLVTNSDSNVPERDAALKN